MELDALSQGIPWVFHFLSYAGIGWFHADAFEVHDGVSNWGLVKGIGISRMRKDDGASETND